MQNSLIFMRNMNTSRNFKKKKSNNISKIQS